MRNVLLSKKLKLSEIRMLIVDDNQVRYNKILEILQDKSHQVNAVLFDDINSFEKNLAVNWDLIVFGRAYDLKLEQAFQIIQNSQQPNIPVLMLRGDDYHPDQYAQYLNKGVFDILNLDFEASTYTMLIRALSYSRLTQNEKRLNEELETMQQQAQNLAQESNKAIALLEEGMHVEANSEYVKLFGFKSEDELIGLPVLDVLQPKNIQQFKQNFKKISQGQFDQTGLEITTSNPNAIYDKFKLEYLPAEEGTIQLIVDVVEGKSSIVKEKVHPLSSAMISLMRHINTNPANANALVVMGLKQCPDVVLAADWDSKQKYFQNINKYLQDYSDVAVHRIDPLTYITLIQAESEQVLEAQLMGLKSLQKPQLLTVDNQTLPLQLRLGYQILNAKDYDDQSFSTLIAEAYNTSLPEIKVEEKDSFFNLIDDIPATPVAAVANPSVVEQELAFELDMPVESPVQRVASEDLSLDLDLDLADAIIQPQVVETKSEQVSSDLTLADDFDLDLDLDLTEQAPQQNIAPEIALELESDLTIADDPILELSLEPEIQLDTEISTPDIKFDTEAKIPEIQLDIEPQTPKIQLEPVALGVEQIEVAEIEKTAEVVIPQPEPVPVANVVQEAKPSISSENWSPILKSLQQNLQHGLVSLKFQQYYDKDDSNMFTYEVSSSFIYDNAWQDLLDMPELDAAPELSIELDRWMVIEASKQLHNFVRQYPNSRIVVNLNKHILTNPQFPELVGKLAKMIGGQQANPLVLQFSELALSENVGMAQHYTTELKKQGVDIAIRDFGTLLLSHTVLERVPVDILGLHTDFNKMIHDTNGSAELQQKINTFREIREVNIVLQKLDDMNSFANAWNVDARFIQSDYFQKKKDQLVMQTQ